MSSKRPKLTPGRYRLAPGVDAAEFVVDLLAANGGGVAVPALGAKFVLRFVEHKVVLTRDGLLIVARRRLGRNGD
jgi:hypothetical protein